MELSSDAISFILLSLFLLVFFTVIITATLTIDMTEKRFGKKLVSAAEVEGCSLKETTATVRIRIKNGKFAGLMSETSIRTHEEELGQEGFA